MMSKRGYYGIGIQDVKSAENVGTLWRSAFIFGASFIFTIGNRYKRQASDTTQAWRHIPLYNYETINDFYKMMPYDFPDVDRYELILLLSVWAVGMICWAVHVYRKRKSLEKLR